MPRTNYLADRTSQQVHDIGVVLQAQDCDHVVGVQGYAQQGCELLLCLGVCSRAPGLQSLGRKS